MCLGLFLDGPKYTSQACLLGQRTLGCLQTSCLLDQSTLGCLQISCLLGQNTQGCLLTNLFIRPKYMSCIKKLFTDWIEFL